MLRLKQVSIRVRLDNRYLDSQDKPQKKEQPHEGNVRGSNLNRREIGGPERLRAEQLPLTIPVSNATVVRFRSTMSESVQMILNSRHNSAEL